MDDMSFEEMSCLSRVASIEELPKRDCRWENGVPHPITDLADMLPCDWMEGVEATDDVSEECRGCLRYLKHVGRV